MKINKLPVKKGDFNPQILRTTHIEKQRSYGSRKGGHSNCIIENGVIFISQKYFEKGVIR